jgi:hypothetical protein
MGCYTTFADFKSNGAERICFCRFLIKPVKVFQVNPAIYRIAFIVCFSPEDGNMLEVFVETRENSVVFKKIHEHAGNSDMSVVVHGRISGFDFPTMQSCRRGIALILNDYREVVQ